MLGAKGSGTDDAANARFLSDELDARTVTARRTTREHDEIIIS